MKQIFICTQKNEDVNGISVHFVLNQEPSTADQGNIAFHNVTEAFAGQFKPGKQYALTLTEIKEAPASK